MRGIMHRNRAAFVHSPLRAPPIFRHVIESVTHVVKIFGAAVNELAERAFLRFLPTENRLRPEITRLAVHVNHPGAFDGAD